jgi:hypothetical protein
VPSPPFFLDPADPAAIHRHLRALGWIENDRVLSAEKIGDGNMNLTVRLRMERHSAILKQARPWVEKYPHIPAPVSRARVEAAFYLAVTSDAAVSGRMPALLGADADSCLLFLEDLHDSVDLTTLYSGDRLTSDECDELMEYLNGLHTLEVGPGSRGVFRNREMRALNHEHQYDLPLRAVNGIDLDRMTPGLSVAADSLKDDRTYCFAVDEARRIAEWTAQHGSGRVGRSEAGRRLDDRALTLAVAASVRHNHTNYDSLLAQGMDRGDARERVRETMDEASIAGELTPPAKAPRRHGRRLVRMAVSSSSPAAAFSATPQDRILPLSWRCCKASIIPSSG